MVKTDVGDDGHQWVDDIGTVEASSQSYLYHGNVNVVVLEVFQRHSRCHLKERGMQRLEEIAFLLHKVGDVFFADGFSVDADSLTEVNQVG